MTIPRTRIRLLTVCAVVLAAALTPLAAPAQESGERSRPDDALRITGSRIAIFESVIVEEDTRIRGDIICIFCELQIDGEVTNSVIVVGGELWLSGDVRGDVVSVLTDNTLEPTARVGGDFNNIVGALDDQGADVRRGYTNIPLGPMLPGIDRPLSVLSTVLFVLRTVMIGLFFVILLVLAALVPERIRTVSEAVPRRYIAAFFVGLAGYAGLWILCVLLIGSVVGILALPFVQIVFVVLKWLGRAAILHQLGHRLGRQLGRELTLLGAIFLGLIPYMLLLILPLLAGWAGLLAHFLITGAFWLLVDVPAVGLILLTRAGGRRRVPPTGPSVGEVTPIVGEPEAPGPSVAGPGAYREAYSPGTAADAPPEAGPTDESKG
jgi:hypothetical protein